MSRNRPKRIFCLSLPGLFFLIVAVAFQRQIVRAAKLEHAAAPAPYFPHGAPWTEDIGHAPLDPQSSAIINWLANAGGWGHGNRM